MAMFGSSWKDDDYDKISSVFSHWADDYDNHKNESPKSVEEILDKIDIKDIENYLRKKKLQNINSNERKR